MIIFKSIDDALPLIYGSAFYGGGGGGSIAEGLEIAETALKIRGEITVLEPNEIDDDNILITVSAVGAPAAKEKYFKPYHVAKAVRLLLEEGINIKGLIPSEIGALNSVFSWPASAILDVPVVDIPCDGRAHPTGVMGSMGLHRNASYLSIQAVAGGNPSKGTLVEAVLTASLNIGSRIVRKIAEEAGGIVAVARNPVSAKYAKSHGAPGALKRAMKVGEIILKGSKENPGEFFYKLFDAVEGKTIGECTVDDVILETKGGFDIGKVKLTCANNRALLLFYNEYMALDLEGKRIATFPDLIVTMDPIKGLPITSSEMSSYVGKKIFLGTVDRKKITLGDGLRYEEVYKDLESNLNINITEYIRDILY